MVTGAVLPPDEWLSLCLSRIGLSASAELVVLDQMLPTRTLAKSRPRRILSTVSGWLLSLDVVFVHWVWPLLRYAACAPFAGSYFSREYMCQNSVSLIAACESLGIGCPQGLNGGLYLGFGVLQWLKSVQIQRHKMRQNATLT